MSLFNQMLLQDNEDNLVTDRQLNRDQQQTLRRLALNNPFSSLNPSSNLTPSAGMLSPSTGMGGGLMGGMVGMMDPSSPYGQAQLRMGNLTNPNQIQGAAQNLGMGLGNAIRAGQGRGPISGDQQQQPQQGQPGQGNDPLTGVMQKWQQYQTPAGGGLPPRIALQKALQESGLSPSDQAMLAERGDKMNDKYLAGPVDIDTARARGWKGKVPEGFVLSQDENGQIKTESLDPMDTVSAVINDDGRTELLKRDKSGNLFHNDGKPYVGNVIGTPTRQTSDVPSHLRDTRLLDLSNRVAETTTINQGIDTIQKSMKENNIAPGGMAAFVADKASDLTGVVGFLKGNLSNKDDPQALEVGNWKSYLAQKGIANQEAQSTVLGLAGILAKMNGGRLGMSEMKVQLDALGDGRVDPAAVSKALEAVRRMANNQMVNAHNSTFPIISAGPNSDASSVKAYSDVFKNFTNTYVNRGAQPAGGRQGTMADVQAYATKHSLSPEAALAHLKGVGVTITDENK